jgi:hypothetical protein
LSRGGSYFSRRSKAASSSAFRRLHNYVSGPAMMTPTWWWFLPQKEQMADFSSTGTISRFQSFWVVG